jgi:hypothetical protein
VIMEVLEAFLRILFLKTNIKRPIYLHTKMNLLITSLITTNIIPTLTINQVLVMMSIPLNLIT